METQSIEKTKRITLGAGDISMSEITARILSYTVGGLLMICSMYYIIGFIVGEAGFSKIIAGISFFLSASIFLFRAQFELSPTSKYAPHFLISKNGLKIKTGVFKKSVFINWVDMIKIELGYYKIGIKDKTGLQYYPYQTRKETSIKIMKTIEEIAPQKGIEVENLLRR
jgi:hypothetical protein